MQILTMVSLMAFLILVLLLFSLATPSGSHRAGNRKTGFYPRCDSHWTAHCTKQLGESR